MANFSSRNESHIDTFEKDTQKSNDNVEGCFSNVRKKRWENGLSEQFNLLADCSRQLRFLRMISAILYDIKNVKVNSYHSEDGHTLLIIGVAEDARNGLLALGIRKHGNERMGCPDEESVFAKGNCH